VKTEQTNDIYLVIDDRAKPVVTYAQSASEAANLAGCEPWDIALQMNAIREMNIGDELNLSEYTSVIRLTGSQIDFTK
jgi:hypothetical protein